MEKLDLRYLVAIVVLAWMGAAGADQRVISLGEDARIDLRVAEGAVQVGTHDDRSVILEGADLNGISVSRDGAVLVIRSDNPSTDGITLLVHPDTPVKVSGEDVEVRVTGLHASVVISNHTQPIRVQDIRGSVDAFSYTGPITLSRIEGQVHAVSNTNAVTIRDVSGEIEARSTTSSVEVANSTGTVVDLQSVSGIVSFEGNIPRNGRFQLGSYSGEVRLKVPVATNATLEMHGRLNTFRIQGARLERVDATSGRVRLGDGHAQVELSAPLGAIQVSVGNAEGKDR